MCTPDENVHFLNASSISAGDIFPEEVDGKIGRYIRQEIYDFVINNNSKYASQLNIKYTYNEQYYNSWLPSEGGESVFLSWGEYLAINPIGYTFSAFGMFIGRVLLGIGSLNHVTPYNLLLFGRFGNLLFYLIAGYMAIKIIPCMKKLTMVLLLLPMSLYLCSSVSYDAILIPVCTLFVANLLRMILSNPEGAITKQEIFITLFCAFFMFGVKYAYIPFVLLLLCIPKKKFESNKNYFRCIGMLIAVAFVAFVVPKLMLSHSLNGYELPEDALITAQREWLLSNLGSIPRIALDTFRANIGFYVTGFFGILGQLDTNIPLPFLVIYMLLFVYVMIGDLCCVNGNNKKIRLVSLFITLVTIAGMFYQIYITWTPGVSGVGTTVVSGIQGRYFIPIFIMACVPFMNRNFIRNEKIGKYVLMKQEICSYGVAVFGAGLTVLTTFLRFWI